MKRIIVSLLLVSGIFLISGCDSKDVAKQIALSTYNDLMNKYNSLVSNYNILNDNNKQLNKKVNNLTQQNNNLHNENQDLKQKLSKYSNGFKSMYE